jgi:hypothetical protein
MLRSIPRADAVVGHFDFKAGTKTGLVLRRDATQFVVLEAKIGSRLSSGTTNATTFNQAARNVACIAHALSQADRPPNQMESGFYVLAPERAIAAGSLRATLEPERLLRGIDERIARYGGQRRAELESGGRGVDCAYACRPTARLLVLGREPAADRARRPGARRSARGFYAKTLPFCGWPAVSTPRVRVQKSPI